MSGIPFKVVFGTAGFGDTGKYRKLEDVQPIFDILAKEGVTHLDTAQLYGNSETYIGEVKAGEKFGLDTKWFGGFKPGESDKDNTIRLAKESIQKLGVKKVDIFYLHAPDSTHPIADTLEGVNEAYKLGLFERFGLSVSNIPSQHATTLTSARTSARPRSKRLTTSANPKATRSLASTKGITMPLLALLKLNSSRFSASSTLLSMRTLLWLAVFSPRRRRRLPMEQDDLARKESRSIATYITNQRT